MRADRRRKSYISLGCISALLQNAKAWWLPWGGGPLVPEPRPPIPGPELPFLYNITIILGEEAGMEWLEGAEAARATDAGFTREGVESRRSGAVPPRWDSSSCMARWGVPELQTEADPGGYLVFSEGREQLGNNRFLLSDGLVIARALNRTLVEFPMQDSRIATADAELGSCDYWDCERLCSYHRILDLWTFRSMLESGVVSFGDFLTLLSADKEQDLLPSLVTAGNITDFFGEYDQWEVLVMKMAWKSALRREPVDLLRPNPFYVDLVGRLIDAQEGWEDGEFMAVQWRTETSTGNLTECYELHVRSAVEEERRALGFDRNQVFFNTDLVGQASTTYNASTVSAYQNVVEMIREDYPAAMNNVVYDCLANQQDAGVKAMISGMVSASAGFLLSSSFNGSGSIECQKPHSKYIDLVAEWRLDFVGKNRTSIGQMLPAPAEPAGTGLGLWLALLLAGFVALVALAWVRRKSSGNVTVGRLRAKKTP